MNRYRAVILLMLLWVAVGPIRAQTLQLVRPSQTDPGITQYDNYHFIFLNSNILARGELFVFLPGTGGAPAGYTNVIRTAANLGLHAVGLMYPNGVTMNSLCADSTNPDCYAETRLAVINGGTNAQISISATDCITNRLVKLILFLASNSPSQNWPQFLDSNFLPNWPKIVIAGHSQGAGHAGLIGKTCPVARSLMFADTDWWTPNGELPGQPAPWITNSGVTPPQYFFGFVHTNDPLIPYGEETVTWTDYGLAPFGGPRLVEDNVPPYHGSHEFITGLTPNNFSSALDYHGATVVDSVTPFTTNGTPAYLPVWQYMMIGPPGLPALQIYSDDSSQLYLHFATLTNYTYQLQSAGNLSGTWNDIGASVSGDGSTASLLLSQTNSSQFYRVAVIY
jgi:hypothetical protein